MVELTGKSESKLIEELKGEIVLTPEGDYVLTDIYLSGNIYEKLDAVRGKPEFKAQEEMLESVIPTPKGASDITVKLGANYIDTAYVEQFAREVLNSYLTIKKDVTGSWVIEGVRQSRYGDVVNVKFGCEAFNAVQLLEKILNDGDITATKKVGHGDKAVTVYDAEMTDVARQKADDIRAAFDSWIFADSERRSEIVNKYNRLFNNYRPLDYTRIAQKLSFDSMDASLKSKLYPHQKKGIARFVFGGNILFAHGVGTGKTFEMIASVMEAKRMGIVNKTAMVVPNNKVVDF
jgi:N12 class adenine-specific DNA methylase